MSTSRRAPGYCIILAAGAGTRMRSPDLPKVCFPIDGIPAISRSLRIYRTCGIRQPILVVGVMAEKVKQTVDYEFEGIAYAYQAEQLGTAHAARVGMQALKELPHEEDPEVLIVAGDRLVQPQVLTQLFEQFYSQEADLAFLTGPNPTKGEPAGRVIYQANGNLLGNVEARDLHQREILRRLRQHAEQGIPFQREEALAHIREHFNAKKAAIAFGDLWDDISDDNYPLTNEELLARIPEKMTSFQFQRSHAESITVPLEEISRSQEANLSVYLVKLSRLETIFAQLNRQNAQGEEYLSDMISIAAAQGWRTVPLFVADPDLVMGFNTPQELDEIERYIRTLKTFHPLADWQRALTPDSPGSLEEELTDIYGDDTDFLLERRSRWQNVLKASADIYGTEAEVGLVRAPGRINLMGRHVDHQGGHCNLMTTNRECIAVVRPRADDRVCLFNLDSERYPSRFFSISELAAQFPQEDWLELVNSPAAQALVRQEAGDWVQYVRAAALRLQKAFPGESLRGVDLVVDGSIPPAAGLSSSSSLVVLAAEALLAANRLQMPPAKLVELCGEGEWFVGTRGGSADHAAIKLGGRGSVLQVAFFDFAVGERVPFPNNLVLAVCDSGIQAKKTAGARDQYNHRVACYRLGFKLVRRKFPEFAERLNHLRDINTRHLNVPLSEIYRILLSLPEGINREELVSELAGEDLQPLFSTHVPPDDGLYPIRGVVLFGLAECERSRSFAEALQSGDLERVGKMMNLSHHGDRVWQFNGDGQGIPYQAPTSDDYLNSLIADLESGDLERAARAQLEWQPGSYRCSLPEIDRMVDLALGVDGVIGAQLAGAGLGGSMMVLAHRDSADELHRCLEQGYYLPYGKQLSMFFCHPVSRSGMLSFDMQ